VKVDEEATARLQKERDELLQKDAASSERVGELLAELETERDLRRQAEDKSMALQQKADQDAMVIDRLHREQDELSWTKDRLRSEHSTAHEECDWATRERDKARREAEARRVWRWPDGWMPREFLLVYAPILPMRGGFFRSKVTSMVAYPPPS